jgi:hypothetical protein
MKRTTLNILAGIAVTAMAAMSGAPSTAQADPPDVIVSGQAGVRVWVDGGDIFPAYNDVSIYLRADRDCYATLLLVDTDGYMHVLYPSSPYDRAWLYGGRTYRYNACDLGLDRLDGVGIAHLYAVGSPVPFDYSYYGASVFVGGFGFRVYGDPYVACRNFYVSLLPVSCRWDFVSVGCARFYVHEWVRYPAYLCSPAMGGVHVRVGDNCRQCASAYESYRCNVADPYDALRPVPAKFKGVYRAERTQTAAGRVAQAPVRVRSVERTVAPRTVARVDRVKVVSTSGSREVARTPVKVSERKIKDTSVRPGADNARAERGTAAKTKKNVRVERSSTASKQKKGAAKQVRQAR